MTEISIPVRGTFHLSPRTANYIAALFREGDKFDYCTWLQRVREKETQAKQEPLTSAALELVAAGLGDHTGNSLATKPKALLAKRAMPFPTGFRQATHSAFKSRSPHTGIRRWLAKIRDAWEEFQSSRARDAVYVYLEAVFAIVQHYKVRRKTQKLLRHAFKFAKLAFKDADPFTAVIRCTSDDGADERQSANGQELCGTWRIARCPGRS